MWYCMCSDADDVVPLHEAAPSLRKAFDPYPPPVQMVEISYRGGKTHAWYVGQNDTYVGIVFSSKLREFLFYVVKIEIYLYTYDFL